MNLLKTVRGKSGIKDDLRRFRSVAEAKVRRRVWVQDDEDSVLVVNRPVGKMWWVEIVKMDSGPCNFDPTLGVNRIVFVVEGRAGTQGLSRED